MSFLFGGAPKMSSAEKIAAAETEVEMISDMFNRYVEAPRDIQALYLDSETSRTAETPIPIHLRTIRIPNPF